MDVKDVRQALALTVGLAVGIGLVSLVSGGGLRPGFVVATLLVFPVVLALSTLDGPLEARTARVGAVVLSVGLLGAARWLY
ncbi:hypothetical protein [Natronorubrum texcoconense]|uniref:Uncharacterized protein n=1 Tax=Natronorubrum texcoconense TaxID=1095776 RepID=A0A1G9ALC7_9EURY|nr:hypothetical protein [Natronorubrum texcoconense]SDK27315.1 hypothetical protein SAMN04515672_2764 [Natronorubrum texcoconense]